MERGHSKGPQHRTVAAIADALALDEAAREQLIELAREGRLQDHRTRPIGLCELPGSIDDFTGRTAELAWMDDLPHADASPARSTRFPRTSPGVLRCTDRCCGTGAC